MCVGSCQASRKVSKVIRRRTFKWEAATTFPGLEGFEFQVRDVQSTERLFFSRLEGSSSFRVRALAMPANQHRKGPSSIHCPSLLSHNLSHSISICLALCRWSTSNFNENHRQRDEHIQGTFISASVQSRTLPSLPHFPT